MIKNIILNILPNGSISIRREDKVHNEHMLDILSQLVDDTSISDLVKFFEGSEDTELIIGDTVWCG